MPNIDPSTDARPFDIRPLHPTFGVEILGVDLSRPMDESVFAHIREAFLRYQLLLFRGQELEPGDQVGFARLFGEVQVHVMNQYHDGAYPELYTLSNLDENGNPNGIHPDRGTLEWHTDGSWQRVTGQATLLYTVEVPREGGETSFADMYAAYDALDEDTKRQLADMRAMHSLDFSRTRRHGEDPMTEEQRKAVPPVDHPIVRTHPDTGRKCIYLGDHAWHVAGQDVETSRPVIDRINALAIRDDNVYCHRWRPHDLMVWDNRCLQHRAGAYDTARERRVIRRCTVLGDVPV